MKKIFSRLNAFAQYLDSPDDPHVAAYDPVHIGIVLVVGLSVAGALYWLLWTLLVYEGGLFLKLKAGVSVLLTAKTLRDYGYRGSYDQGQFEGWFGNLAALAISLLLLAVLHHLYETAARRSARK